MRDDRLITYIQTEVTTIAKQKYPNNERLQWIYVHGFLSAQLSMAIQHDNRVLSSFKAAIDQQKERKWSPGSDSK